MNETPKDTASLRVTRVSPPTRQHGPAIAALREKDGYSQNKFAHALGISQGHLSAVEREVDNASIPLLNLIRHRLGVPLAAILRSREIEDAPADETPAEHAEAAA